MKVERTDREATMRNSALEAIAVAAFVGLFTAGSASGQADEPPDNQPRRPPASIWTQPGTPRGPASDAPIPLDSREPRYQDYFNKLREKIRAKWVYPRPAGERGIEGELLIEFHIAKDGRLEFIELRHSSGTAILDDAALTAIKVAQPFPPVPDKIAKQTLAIDCMFRYQIVRGSGNTSGGTTSFSPGETPPQAR